jgi:serine/threonine-protein kinase
MEDLTGQQFGAYQIVAPLGEGGMAAVYKAYQPAVDRYVAIKVLPRQYAADPDFTARFEREARLLARLQHPHILPIFDYGQANGYTYLVMPFVPSGTLTDLLKGEPLPLLQVRRLMTQIGEALAYAHAHGLIHRDVKPSNVLLDESGNCLLSDFGLARMAEGSLKLTVTGAVLGTPAYMSPEQGMGQPLDGRSDVYALGVILYEAITGRVPYRAETPVAVIFKHISDPLPPACELNPALPEPVERVLLKALAKRPEDRFQTAAEMVAALQVAIPETGQPTALPPPPPIQPATLATPASHPSIATPVTTKTALPGWVWFAVGLGLLAVVGAAGLAALWPLLNPPEPPLIVITATPPPEVASPLPPSPTMTLPTATLPPPTTPPTEAPPSTRLAAKDGMPQVFVPAGDFRFGSDFSVQTLPAFWMDQTEVTNAMYARCVGEGACRPPAGKASETRDVYYGNPAFDSYPVIYVDWSDADAYCRWAGRRLPTEAEWEKAARGTDGRTYPWGQAAPQPDAANYGRLVGDTTMAGAYPKGASPYGVLDMIGNVAEWVDAWHSEGYRLLKGGSWVTDANGLKAWGRFGSRPTNRYADYGFRCLEPEAAPARTTPPRLTNFRFCDRPCSQTEARTLTVFPERVTEIYFSWEYSGMSPGLEYVRTWSSNGDEWVRYNCRWQGAESGVFYGRLWDRDGLRSGEWKVKITVTGGFTFSQSVFVEGNYTFWSPAGNLACPDFK